MQAPGDHQMEDQPIVAFEAERQSFAQPPQLRDKAAFEGIKGRIDGPEKKRACSPDAPQRLSQDPLFQGLQIDRDVGQLWHGPASMRASAAGLNDTGPGRRRRGACCRFLAPEKDGPPGSRCQPDIGQGPKVPGKVTSDLRPVIAVYGRAPEL